MFEIELTIVILNIRPSFLQGTKIQCPQNHAPKQKNRAILSNDKDEVASIYDDVESNRTISPYPCDKIDFLFLWGNKKIFQSKTKSQKEQIFDFLNEFFCH